MEIADLTEKRLVADLVPSHYFSQAVLESGVVLKPLLLVLLDLLQQFFDGRSYIS